MPTQTSKSENLSKGKKGEELAAEFLLKKGHKILEKNFRAGRGEIDLITSSDNLIVFVEVKLRNRTDYGFPEEGVTAAKAEKVKETAERYLEEKKWNGDIRFDIIAITKNTIEHFIDAF